MSVAQMPNIQQTIIRQMPSVRIFNTSPIVFTSGRMAATDAKTGKSCFKTYNLPAAKRGSWTFVEIEPELVRLPAYDDDAPSGFKDEYQDPSIVAQRLASIWGYPGVVHGGNLSGRFGVFAGAPGQTEPTQQQLDQANKENEQLANAFVAHGTDLSERGNNHLISNIHRLMAKWLFGDKAENLPWYGQRTFSNLKYCIACRAQMDELSTKCPMCHEDLVERYIRNGDEGVDDPVVRKRAEAVMKHRAAASKPVDVAEIVPPAPAPAPQPKSPGVILPPIKPPAA